MNDRCCPETPDCCDMRGMLSFYILWLLSKGPMNGQVISEELGKRRGTQPTPGTLYPALKELRGKGLVEMEREGRKTIYTISENGREGLEKACKYFCSAFGEIFREYNRSVRSPKERKIQVRKKTSREGVSKDKRPA